MRSAILGFVVGVGWLQMQAQLPTPATLSLIFFVGMLALLLPQRIPALQHRTVINIPLWVICGAGAGFIWAAQMAQHTLQQELPAAAEGRDITLIGTIDSLPSRFEQGLRFNFAVEQVLPGDGETLQVPDKIALSWYAGFRAERSQTVADVQPGERWQFTVRLQRPHGNANPHGFDYEAWLLEQNLRATGYVRPDKNSDLKNQRLQGFVFSVGNVVERSRAWLRQRIVAALPQQPYAGVIVALVVGDQRALSQSDWTIFNRTGISHLISISGLHITMIAGLFAGLFFTLWRRSFFTGANLPLLLPAQKAAALAGAGIALLYVLLAGCGVPAQRTLYMLSVVALALWYDRLTSVSHVLCLALLVVLVLDPWAVLWPGFWLSFGAVAIILYATVGRAALPAAVEPTRRQRWLGAIRSGAHTQYVVTLGLVPLTLLLFGQISLVSPFANALAIPLVGLVVTPLALLGSILPAPLSGWLLQAAHALVQMLASILSWLSAAPLAVWSAPVPSWWLFGFALIGTLWMLAPRGWPIRWIGVAGWLPLLFNVPAQPAAASMWVTAFDVGQGTALLIETPQHRLLYDTGPYYSPDSNGATRVILPYLKARGINALDAVIVSHSDNDHAGGALALMEALKVGWVSSSLPLDAPIVAAAPAHRRCVAGQRWNWDGVEFEMLHPTSVSYDSSKWKPNARSCTLKVTLNGQSILLAGDIEAVQEAELLASDPEKLRASVLLAPHHGSGTSSTLPFLRAVNPQIALFQMGYRNRYRHPKAEVFARYGDLGIQRLRSDESGAVSVHFGEDVTYSAYRTTHARYWHGR